MQTFRLPRASETLNEGQGDWKQHQTVQYLVTICFSSLTEAGKKNIWT